MSDLYYYEVNLLWDAGLHGTSCPEMPGRADKAAGTKLEKGTKEKWTPEHLFVASVNSFLMSAFLLVANSSKFKFISFETNAVGTIEKLKGGFFVTEIFLKPRLIIASEKSMRTAKRVIAMSEKACALANSGKTAIALETIITVG